MQGPHLAVTSLRSYEPWMQGAKLGFWGYLDVKATVELAAGFAKLHWPDFIEVDNCVLLAERCTPSNFEQWTQHFGGNRHSIESMINHTHDYDLFNYAADRETVAPDVWEHIGQTLLASWRAAIHQAFPARRFAFDYATEPNEYGPTITFWQED